MGFFSRKSAEFDKNDTHEMVNAKIHVMQNDLEEISKNGHIKMESLPEKQANLEQKESASAPKEPLPTDNPFSQSIYPPSSEPLPEKTPSTLSPPEALRAELSKKELSREVFSEPKNIPTIDRSSAPLNLPTFEATQTSVPREPSLSKIIKEEKRELLPSELRRTPMEPFKQLEKNQDAIRTGAWPTEPATKIEPGRKAPTPETTPEKLSPRKEALNTGSLSDNIILKEGWGWKRFSVFILVLLIIGGSAYYFWKTRFFERDTPEIPLSNIPDITNNPKTEELLAQPEENLPFSTTNTNTFLIDVETETVSTLREKLMKNAAMMQQSGMSGPIPFSVVDKTNTPIAFFIFASIFNLGLSSELLNSLDNEFTLSMFLDNGNEPCIMLAIKIKNAEDTRKHLTISEKTLPLSLKNILLIEAPLAISTASFNTSSYRDVSIRYFNFSSESPLSLDYAFIENTLIIGTSKNSARTEIDAILNAKK